MRSMYVCTPSDIGPFDSLKYALCQVVGTVSRSTISLEMVGKEDSEFESVKKRYVVVRPFSLFGGRGTDIK